MPGNKGFYEIIEIGITGAKELKDCLGAIQKNVHVDDFHRQMELLSQSAAVGKNRTPCAN